MSNFIVTPVVPTPENKSKAETLQRLLDWYFQNEAKIDPRVPITMKMMDNYYNEHPEKSGAISVDWDKGMGVPND